MYENEVNFKGLIRLITYVISVHFFEVEHVFMLRARIASKSGIQCKHKGSISRWGGGNFEILRFFLRDCCIALKIHFYLL